MTKTNIKRLKRIWVVFPDAATGSLLREDSKRKGITNKNPLAVPISEIKASFEIPRIRMKVTRTQFPMVLCFCMTSYKSQGQTLDAVILDFKDAIAKHGHFYVGVTRVRNSDGLFVRNFKPSQVLCREDVKLQMKLLRKTRQYTFSKTYLDTKIWNTSSELRVGYININGLLHNLNNLDKDYNTGNLDFLCIAETKLDESVTDDQVNEGLNLFKICYREDVQSSNEHPHMGFILLENKSRNKWAYNVSCEIFEYSAKKMQICKLSLHGTISVVFVYINKTPGISETHDIGKVLAKLDVSVVLGDFNIDYHKEDGRKKIQILEEYLHMTQINKMPTRYKATLDLIFRKEMTETDFMPHVFENLFSDHSSIGFRYCENGQILDDFRKHKIFIQDKEFLKKITIEADKENILESEEVGNPESARINQKLENDDVIILESEEVGNPESARINQELENDDVIFRCPLDLVRTSNLRKLSTGEWIDSHAINCYMFLISKEYPGVKILDTHFNVRLTTRSFTLINRSLRDARIFEHSLLLIPINCDNLHWFLLTIVTSELRMNKITINIYDSSPKYIDWRDIIDQDKWKSFLNWKHQEDYGDNQITLDITFNDSISDVPRQINGSDCGVFTLMYARHLAAGKEFDFGQEDMKRIRHAIVSELSDGKLDPNFKIHNEQNGVCLDDVKRESKKKAGKNILGTSRDRRTKFSEDDSDKIGDKFRCSKDAATKKKNKQDHVLADKVIIAPAKKKPRNIAQPVDSGNMKIIRFFNRNGRNLCFSNSVTSVLLNTSGIRDIITGDTPLRIDNAIFIELKKLYETENFAYSSTRGLRQIVQNDCLINGEQRNFDDNNQHDASEFLQSLVEHLLENDVCLTNYLFGSSTTAKFCRNGNCNNTNYNSQPEVIITLPLVEYTLENNLQHYFDEEIIERKCSKCGHNEGTQVISFSDDPELLIIQLKRFKYENNRAHKIDSEVSVPLRLSLPSGSLYKIIGTVNHIGNSTASGHYTSTVYNEGKKNFFLVDDEQIQEIDSLNDTVFGQSIAKTIYLIFYRQV